MKKYEVTLEFSGTTITEVEANSREEASDIARENTVLSNDIEIDNISIYQIEDLDETFVKENTVPMFN